MLRFLIESFIAGQNVYLALFKHFFFLHFTVSVFSKGFLKILQIVLEKLYDKNPNAVKVRDKPDILFHPV